MRLKSLPLPLLLSALLALAILFSQAPARAGETVTITREGLTLAGNLELADGKSMADGIVLVTHGTLGHNKMETIAAVQATLLDRDISSLAINLSLGIDKRDAPFDCATYHTHKHTDAMGEIGVWVGWLKKQGAARIFLMGHSRGGNQTAWYLAENPDAPVAGAVLLAPATWSEDKAAKSYEKRAGVPLAAMMDKAKALPADGKLEKIAFIYCQDATVRADSFLDYYTPDSRFDTPSLLGNISKPLLVIAGSADTTVPDLAEKMESVSADNVTFVMVDGSDHFFLDLFAEDVADAVAEFIGE